MPELYIKIPVSFQNKINEILKPINNLSFKGSQVIDILNEQTSSYNQLYFQAVHEFIKHVEHEDKYSYYDKTAKVMSIGIGFNLEQPGADKIIESLGLDYKSLLTPGMPKNGLTDEQLAKLFHYTMLGYGKFVGKAPILKTRLKTGHLLDHTFLARELVALQSLAFDNAFLVGPKLMAAISKGGKEGHLAAMSQIIEYSNAAYNNGLSNRMLQTGAVYHGDPSDVQLTWRAYKLIEAAMKVPLTLIGGLPTHALPFGNDEETYRGPDNLPPPIIGGDSGGYDLVQFGSNKADRLITNTPGNQVLMGGDGDDFLQINMVSFASYLAGGIGYDSYYLDSHAGHVLIYDADRWGQIFVDGYKVAGNAWKLPGQSAYAIITEHKTFILHEPTKSYELPKLTWGDPHNDITFPSFNFNDGQFGIILNNLRMGLISVYGDHGYYGNVAVFDNGCVGLVLNNNIFIFEESGQLINRISLSSLLGGHYIAALTGGRFILTQRTAQEFRTSDVRAYIGNTKSNQLTEVFSKHCEFDAETRSGCYVHGGIVYGLSDGDYAIFYTECCIGGLPYIDYVTTSKGTQILARGITGKPGGTGLFGIYPIHNGEYAYVLSESIKPYGTQLTFVSPMGRQVDVSYTFPPRYGIVTAPYPGGFLLGRYGNDDLLLSRLSSQVYPSALKPLEIAKYVTPLTDRVMACYIEQDRLFLSWGYRQGVMGMPDSFGIILDTKNQPMDQAFWIGGTPVVATHQEKGGCRYVNSWYESGYTYYQISQLGGPKSPEPVPRPPISSSANRLKSGLMFNLFSLSAYVMRQGMLQLGDEVMEIRTHSTHMLNAGFTSFANWFSPKVKIAGYGKNPLPLFVNSPNSSGYSQKALQMLEQGPYHLALGLVLWQMIKEGYYRLTGQAKVVREAKVNEQERQRLTELEQYGHNPYAKVYLETLYKIEIGLGDEEDFTQAIVQLANEHESALITLLALALLNKQDKAEAVSKELPQDLQAVLECWSEEAYRVVAQLPKTSDYLDKAFKLLAETADKRRVMPISNKASRYYGLFKTEATTKITPLMSKQPYFFKPNDNSKPILLSHIPLQLNANSQLQL